MPNGCLCCRVRGDLVEALRRLGDRSEALDALLVECSGLSEVLPVAQTFFSEPEAMRNPSISSRCPAISFTFPRNFNDFSTIFNGFQRISMDFSLFHFSKWDAFEL